MGKIGGEMNDFDWDFFSSIGEWPPINKWDLMSERERYTYPGIFVRIFNG